MGRGLRGLEFRHHAVVDHGRFVGVFDALPGRPEVDGLLGASFLHHFKFTVDRKNLQLLLEPVAAEK